VLVVVVMVRVSDSSSVSYCCCATAQEITITLLSKLASLNMEQDKPKKAVLHLREAVALQKGRKQDDPEEYLALLTTLAQAYFSAEMSKEATAAYDEALQFADTKCGAWERVHTHLEYANFLSEYVATVLGLALATIVLILCACLFACLLASYQH
jgi:tetratricopeptide (TPR) repeat protein